MDQNTRIRVLIIVVVLAIGGGVFFLNNARQTALNQKTQKEKLLKSTQDQLSQAMMKLAAVSKEKKEKEEELSARIEELNALSEDLIKENENSLTAQSEKIKALLLENDALKKGKDEQSQEIRNLTARIASLENEKNDLERQIGEFAKKNQSPYLSADDIEAQGDEVNLGELKVQKAAGDGAEEPLGIPVMKQSTGLPASVQTYNKAYGFVVIDAGSSDGLQKNMVLALIRADRVVGRALVEKTKEYSSAAILLPEWTRSEPKVHDKVHRI